MRLSVTAKNLLIQLFTLLALPVLSQESRAALPLEVQDATISETVDVYGRAISQVDGQLLNITDDNYANVMLTAEVFDASDTLIGEGIGFLVDACGAGLLPDYQIPPDHHQRFIVPLELFEEDSTIGRVEIIASGDAMPAQDSITLPEGVRQLSDQEVVTLAWAGPRSIRYAAGCPRDLPSDWAFTRYNTLTESLQSEVNPFAPLITDELRERLGLNDPLLFANSRLTFAPSGSRLVYQDPVNRFYTAAIDGRLQRQLFGGLNSRTLQRIEWLAGDRFIAYYYGAFGDPVEYFTADAEGRFISASPTQNRDSVIMPGASVDGRRVVVAGTFDSDAGAGITGYYIHVVSNGFFELLFEGDSPGNNYPPPIPIVNPEEDRVTRVYLVRPADGSPVLQCFNRDENTLYTLTDIPLRLADGDRSGMWLSPDETTIALTATGVNGGLWLLDLGAFPACSTS
jgi:hypothetical protein